MKVLVVYAHPSSNSFATASLDRVLTGLGAGRHDVTVMDLYAEYASARAASSHAQAVQPPTASDGQADSAKPGDSAGRSRWHAAIWAADALVFVYPTWWSGPPAILLGWLQSVLSEPKRTVGHRRHWFAPARPGSGPAVRRIVVVTSHGSSKLVNMVEGESGKLLFQRALRVRLGRLTRTRFRWIALYKIDRSSSAERTAHLDRVEQHFAAW